MPVLCDEDQYRIRHHLNYKTGVTDAGVFAWLLTSMNTIDSNYQISQIQDMLTRCELAFQETQTGGQDTGNQGMALAAKELYDGDLTRTRIQLRALDLKERWNTYYLETDFLADTLNVPNLRRPGANETHSHLISGGAFIKAIPGPADTCISDKLYFQAHFK